MHGDNMNINAETKRKLDDLLQDLKSNDKKIYYCSMAEVFQRNFFANFKIAASFDKKKEGRYDEAICDVVDAINRLGDLVSSEVLVHLGYHLLETNDFYYYGIFNEMVKEYFDKGSFGLVPVLDRPYIKVASEIAYNKNTKMHDAYNLALYQRDFTSLKQFIYETVGVPVQNCLHKEHNEIIEEIKQFYNEIKNN